MARTNVRAARSEIGKCLGLVKAKKCLINRATKITAPVVFNSILVNWIRVPAVIRSNEHGRTKLKHNREAETEDSSCTCNATRIISQTFPFQLSTSRSETDEGKARLKIVIGNSCSAGKVGPSIISLRNYHRVLTTVSVVYRVHKIPCSALQRRFSVTETRRDETVNYETVACDVRITMILLRDGDRIFRVRDTDSKRIEDDRDISVMVSRIFHGSAELSAKSQPLEGWGQWSAARLVRREWRGPRAVRNRAVVAPDRESAAAQWRSPGNGQPGGAPPAFIDNTQGAEALSAVHLINCTICIGLSRGFCDKIDLRARAASYNNKIEEVSMASVREKQK